MILNSGALVNICGGGGEDMPGRGADELTLTVNFLGLTEVSAICAGTIGLIIRVELMS